MLLQSYFRLPSKPFSPVGPICFSFSRGMLRPLARACHTAQLRQQAHGAAAAIHCETFSKVDNLMRQTCSSSASPPRAQTCFSRNASDPCSATKSHASICARHADSEQSVRTATRTREASGAFGQGCPAAVGWESAT